MSFESMVLDLPIFKSAVVSLDVAFSGVIWGWYVTMNMWAKSVSTGIFFIGIYMMKRYPNNASFYKPLVPIIGIIFLAITLLFTALDLHQMFRAWHMFVYPHMTSVINIGSWFLNLYGVILALMLFALFKGDNALFEKMIIPGAVLAFFTTIYTAGLMAQATAREIWQGPTELVQMLLSAGIAGSATLLILGHFSLEKEEKKKLAHILAFSAFISLSVYLFEIFFAPQKSEEAAWVIHFLTSAEMSTFFYSALALGFVIPTILVAICRNTDKQSGLLIAAVLSLIGLWMAKHSWLIAPQMIPLS